MFPRDDGEKYCEFMRATPTDGEWGDGRPLAVASSVFGMRMQVACDWPHIFGSGRPIWTVRFDAHLEHYALVAE